jgi:hypothetical protein
MKKYDEIVEFLKSKKVDNYNYRIEQEIIGDGEPTDYVKVTVSYTAKKLKEDLIKYGFRVILKRFPTADAWIDNRYITILQIPFEK